MKTKSEHDEPLNIFKNSSNDTFNFFASKHCFSLSQNKQKIKLKILFSREFAIFHVFTKIIEKYTINWKDVQFEPNFYL